MLRGSMPESTRRASLLVRASVENQETFVPTISYDDTSEPLKLQTNAAIRSPGNLITTPVVSSTPSNRAEMADLRTLVAPDWADALEPVHDAITAAGEFLRAEIAAGHSYLPAGPDILRAFREPMAQVRVLIVGQDPYPTPGHPMGLSFSVHAHVRPLPPSLGNIFRELQDDLGIQPSSHGDLSAWAAQGVLLLNRVLTVRAGTPASARTPRPAPRREEEP